MEFKKYLGLIIDSYIKFIKNNDKNIYSKFNKVIQYNTHLKYYNLFNNRLKILCKKNNYNFLEINKYFKKEDGTYKIPSKYLKKEINHHLKNDVVELYLKSLN